MTDPAAAGPTAGPAGVTRSGDPRSGARLGIIGGYLGAGKSTLVNRLLAGILPGRTAVVVNDFGAVNIDAALIAAASDDTIELTNGCICCQISDDALRTMSALAARDDLDRLGAERPAAMAAVTPHLPTMERLADMCEQEGRQWREEDLAGAKEARMIAAARSCRAALASSARTSAPKSDRMRRMAARNIWSLPPK